MLRAIWANITNAAVRGAAPPSTHTHTRVSCLFAHTRIVCAALCLCVADAKPVLGSEYLGYWRDFYVAMRSAVSVGREEGSEFFWFH